MRYDVLCLIEDKLKRINHALEVSVMEMKNGIIQSQTYLAGNQFEKAKKTTDDCINITSRTRNNIGHAINYIEELKMIIEEYSKYAYSEG